MQTEAFLQIMQMAEKLKCNTRHSWTSSGRHESVAEHSWQLMLMAFFVRDEYPKLDMDKVMKMCLIHDLGEAITGDIPAFEKTSADEKKEDALLLKWVETIPEPYRQEMEALYAEMNALETQEAKLYKALDKMEAVIQHNQADLSTWLPLEYDLQFDYGKEQVAFSEYTRALKAAVDEQTKNKIEQGAHMHGDSI